MLNSLLKIVGEGNASIAEPDLVAYSTDASQIFGKAKAVVWPNSTEQIRKLVLLANRTNTPLVIRGGGTSLVGGAVPNNAIIVDVSRLNQIIKIDVNNALAIVEPGVVLDDLNKQLEQYNLFFPIIPASHPSCTIGGMVSTNAAGLRAIKYGKTSEWLLGLEVIDGTGKFFEVKNRREIDSFCGTEGIIGIVISITLKLTTPLTKITASLYTTNTIPELVEKAKSLFSKNLVGMEYINKKAAVIMNLPEQNHLIVEFEGDEGILKEKPEVDALVEKRESFTSEVSKQGYTIMEDPCVELNNIQRLLEWFDKHNLPCSGHLGLGIMHPVFKPETKSLIPEMYNLVSSLNGMVSGEHGIGINKKRYVTPNLVAKLKQLKKEHDPNNLLNPGKVIDL